MNRFRRCLGFAAFSMLFAAMPALCAELFGDDFTDPAASHQKWMNLDDAAVTVADGGCTIDNGPGSVSEYYHDFGASKPEVFTLSFTLKSIERGSVAGALFCRQGNSSGNVTGGYVLTARSDTVIVYKLTLSGNSYGLNSVLYQRSADVLPANNKLTVSKNGSTFHVFANDEFVGEFTDADYGPGDISLFTFSNTKAVFGALSVTDAFQNGKRTEFSDNFDNASLKYWNYLQGSGPAPEIRAADGKLKITTVDGGDGPSGAAWMYVDIELSEFEARVEASHVSGSNTSPYGFILIGDGPSEIAYFAIRGGRRYLVWRQGEPQPDPVLASSINGAGYTDLLEIKKTKESPGYEFYANGALLSPREDWQDWPSLVNFKITGIGLFAQNELAAEFDNFYVKEKQQTSSIRTYNNSKRISRAPSAQKSANPAFYDLRGRKRYTLTAAPNRASIKRAAGVYVNENGREVRVRGRK
ncbi:MAG: hypothetical protein LBH93_06415 [Chitinispirillales bacterium]|jgi:hypothetical protein|nr:hypothetical protein [Chitinispirillales bacterium]